MNTNYQSAATKFEIYDSEMQSMVCAIDCMDEASVSIDLRGAFNAYSFMQLVPHIVDAMRKMALEGDDYSAIDTTKGDEDWKGDFERLDNLMQYERDAIKDIKEERDILQLKFAELTATFEEMKKDRDTAALGVNELSNQRSLLANAVHIGIQTLSAYEGHIKAAGKTFVRASVARDRMRSALADCDCDWPAHMDY